MSEGELFARAVSECVSTSADVLGSTQKLLADIRHDGSREGISLFEVKNRDLLAYMSEVAHLMGQMSFGESVHGSNATERSVFARTVLERMRPIEHKLKPYVEKAMSSSSSSSNPKHVLRPRPDLMKVGDGEQSDSSEDSDAETNEQAEANKKYVPPKMMAVRYDENEEAKEQRKVERARRRVLQSSLISDLRAQYTEAPEEEQEDRGNRKMRQDDMERKKYEEDYMIRLQMTKKQQHERKLNSRQKVLDELLHFGDYMAMDEKPRGAKDGPRNKRKASVKGGPKGKRRNAGGNRFEKMKGGGGKGGRKHAKSKRR